METQRRRKTVKQMWAVENRPGAREEEKREEEESGGEMKENKRRNQYE